MGAFLAGLLIAETEYRLRIEHSITPFKSLLLGLFFMNIGMTLNINFILDNLQILLLGSAALILTKGFVIVCLCKVFKFRWGSAIHAGLLLAQGGEFAFVLLSIAIKQKILAAGTGQLLLMMVAITMAVTPILSIIGAYIEDKFSFDQKVESNMEFQGVGDLDKHVIIAGFGRIGRIVSFMLAREKINYIAVDANISLVKKARNQGFPIYHGDPSNIATLKAVGAGRAVAIIITIDDKMSLRKAVKTISQHYKNLCIVSKAEDYRHGVGLRKLGANVTVPATIETGIQLGIASLQHLGIPETEIASIKEQLRKSNYSLIQEVELFRGISGTDSATTKAEI
jgi:CPA2 family monovalent cation:H+ antiporter-2